MLSSLELTFAETVCVYAVSPADDIILETFGFNWPLRD